MSAIETRIAEAQAILKDLGFDTERYNERSALTLLALLGLTPDDKWWSATRGLYGTRALMDWMRDHYKKDYAANSRETVRRFTLHQFADALLVEQNPDQPDRPVNSPKWNYAIHTEALEVARLYGTPEYTGAVSAYLAKRPGLVSAYAAARTLDRLPVTLPDGTPIALSPGGQNLVIKAMIEDFCSYFTPGGQVLYIGDADAKFAVFEEKALEDLGVTVDQHGKMPDLVVYMPDKNWLVLMEAVTTHGPVDAKRHGELSKLFADSTAGLVFVSCFPSRAVMRRYLADIAWESEAWCADAPTHMVHFNGSRFLGPYE